MKLKYFALLPLFFTFSFIFSQSDKHNPWIIELGESVANPLSNQEISFIKSALGEDAYYRIYRVIDNLEIVPVEWIDDVITHSLESQPKPQKQSATYKQKSKKTKKNPEIIN